MRTKFTSDGYVLEQIVDLSVCNTFDCGRPDLNDYFHQDVKIYRQELFAQTYKLYKETEPNITVALLDFCNDSVKVGKFRDPPDTNPKIPSGIPFPAVKLTRFGVRTGLHGHHLGTRALNLIKVFFLTDNRTGCRLITVDAYTDVIGFYGKNGFVLLSEKDRNKERRAMWFDLLPLKLGIG